MEKVPHFQHTDSHRKFWCVQDKAFHSAWGERVNEKAFHFPNLPSLSFLQHNALENKRQIIKFENEAPCSCFCPGLLACGHIWEPCVLALMKTFLSELQLVPTAEALSWAVPSGQEWGWPRATRSSSPAPTGAATATRTRSPGAFPSRVWAKVEANTFAVSSLQPLICSHLDGARVRQDPLNNS